ncbi:hypothetical protein PM10SUCC1_32190 [Propionigenium maris DSM 9537]|uniref:Uncharacterized protein n=1 Tax=Propionigenium maris DSM 9537 TaxID=1123000 RepID=A0A9W6GPC8_9FUSO|nr:3TM-type holin [Propionigenium maris]GLI57705.1 hypothetical protein PM10SUCC1_32190 [Propionigenium maris DSM 9537]
MISEALRLGNTIVDKLFPDKEEAARQKIKLLELEQEGKFKSEDLRYAAIMEEARSADKWTSRARPAFMYVMYIFILSAIPMGLLFAFSADVAINVTKGVKMYLEAIPQDLYDVFMWCYLGYGGYRTIDKVAVNKKKLRE